MILVFLLIINKVKNLLGETRGADFHMPGCFVDKTEW